LSGSPPPYITQTNPNQPSEKNGGALCWISLLHREEAYFVAAKTATEICEIEARIFTDCALSY
jgi:hypothetical protein